MPERVAAGWLHNARFEGGGFKGDRLFVLPLRYRWYRTTMYYLVLHKTPIALKRWIRPLLYPARMGI